MKSETQISPEIPSYHRELSQFVARLISHLDWRHSGLGMLQAYVREGATDELRVHIWHPSLRHQGIEESGLIHDHRFDLYSRVLVGTIEQVEYAVTPDPEGAWQAHEVIHARAALEKTGSYHAEHTQLPTRLSRQEQRVFINAGWGYYFPKRVFHGTYPRGLTVTVVRKTNQEDIRARILAPYGKPIVAAFDNTLPASAWETPMCEAIEALEAQW